MEWWQIQQLMITLAVIVGVLVPVFALTYRFFTKTPTHERLPSGQDDATALLGDERLDQVERQLEDLHGLVRRLVEAAEFDLQLRSGVPSGADEGTPERHIWEENPTE